MNTFMVHYGTMEAQEKLKKILTETLDAATVDIIDDSAKHAGHAGARESGGHFIVTVVSEKFSGQPLIKRHRMVYEALNAEFKNVIHALSIKALTPDEV